jgi:glucose-1-phosphate thymidylyltransferase
MITIVLAGGYATRLYPLTKSFPKALLPVEGKPMIDHILDKLYEIDRIDKIVVSTNKKFEGQFVNWLRKIDKRKELILTVEQSTNEKEKLGAIKALSEIQKQFKNEEFLVIAGDNLFDSKLNDFIEFYELKKAAVIAGYERRNEIVTKNYSCIEIDAEGRITGLVEKPVNQVTNLIGTCIYAIPQTAMNRIHNYLNEGNSPDSPGYFIAWLCGKEPVYCYILTGRWWDIGTPESYDNVRRFYRSNPISINYE